jgi:ferritin-like protein
MQTQLKTSSQPISSPRAKVERIAEVKSLIETKNAELLAHEYFRLCRENLLAREQVLDVVRQLYCFSVFFERLLARRIAEYSSAMDPRVITMAREHMREEIGHAQMFADTLRANGISSNEIDKLEPAMFTKAMFGYLTVTIQHENEFVSNVAIMQVMESIGYHFFSGTLGAMRTHDMLADAMVQHSEDDEHHSELGLDLIAELDARTMRDCKRVIEDIYRLMGFVLNEWLGVRPFAQPQPPRRRRSSRPPPRVVRGLS